MERVIRRKAELDMLYFDISYFIASATAFGKRNNDNVKYICNTYKVVVSRI